MRAVLDRLALAAVAALFAAQIFLLLQNAGFEPSDDQRTYLRYAERAVESGTWYPSKSNLADGFLFAPGYVNMLALHRRVFGTFAGFGWANLIMSAGILASVYFITKKFFGRTAAACSAILYAAAYSNWFLPVGYFSEVPFAFFMSAASAVAVLPKRGRANFALAGALLAVGNWIRPLAAAYFAAIALYAACGRKHARASVAALSISAVLTAAAIGLVTKSSCGIFAFQSATSGLNLAGSANGFANGLVGFGFERDGFYREKIPADWEEADFARKDALLRGAAAKWIAENPADYLSQLPLKAAVLLGFDTWSERFRKGDGLSSVREKISSDVAFAAGYCAGLFFKSLAYYAAAALFALYLAGIRKNPFRARNALAAAPMLIVALTLPFMVTDRYHYPMMPAVWIYAGAALAGLLRGREGKIPETAPGKPPLSGGASACRGPSKIS